MDAIHSKCVVLCAFIGVTIVAARFHVAYNFILNSKLILSATIFVFI